MHLLKRHLISMEAQFEFVLVLTYSFPASLLDPLLPPGLQLDTFGDSGFVAVACVKTRHMRPKGWTQALGQDFFLVGYRIFSRFRTSAGRNLRGLRILRSDADAETMVLAGNLLTQYHYHHSPVTLRQTEKDLEISVHSNDHLGDLKLKAQLHSNIVDDASANLLPAGSLFKNVRDAMKFAGPLPFTFDYERETNSIIRIEGVRKEWHPVPVLVDVEQCSFFTQSPFNQVEPILCSAFYIKDVPYYWKAGVVESLSAEVNLPEAKSREKSQEKAQKESQKESQREHSQELQEDDRQPQEENIG